MECIDHLVSSCDTLSTVTREAQWNLKMSKPTLKQENEECTDVEKSPCGDYMYPCELLEPLEYVNHYDNKDYVLGQLKMELPVEECPQAESSINSKIISESKELLKLIDKRQIKHKSTSALLPLNMMEEYKDVQYQFTLKAERLQEQGVVDNAGHTNTHDDVPATPREVECNLPGRIFKNSFRLSKSNNDQIKIEINAGDNEMHKSNQCQYCSKYFVSYENMLAHVSDVHSKRKPKCKLCGKQFKSSRNLERHILLLHQYKKPPEQGTRMSLKCKYCNVHFKHEKRLKNHMKLCSSAKDDEGMIYQCDSCEGVYKSKQTLTLHIKRMHYDYGRMFECRCGKKFRSPIHLSVHKRLQHDRKDKDKKPVYKCKVCETVFKVKQSLTHHMKRIHYEYGRMFECWCGKQFRSPIHLKEHVRLRHDRKIRNANNQRFQCDTCQKYFKTKQCLVVHIKRIHYDYGKVFECWCGKQFRSPIQLNVHKKAQHVLVYGGFKFSF